MLVVARPISFSQANGLADRVLVIYNQNIPASLEVADYYLSQRQIPAANKCAIAPSDPSSLDWYEFETKVRTPIRSCINALGPNRILYIVFAYQTPYRILNVPTETGRELRSLDSFIADLWKNDVSDITEITNHPYFAEAQSQGNVYAPFIDFAAYRNQASAAKIYSVWRLDGATVELTKGLVSKAIQAENNGLQGQACLDRRFGPVSGLEDWSYGAGDWDLLRAADFARQIKFTVTEDEQEAEFGTAPAPLRCDNVALYAGWYSYHNYNDAFSWANGAIGFHLDSASAIDPRSGVNWSANALQRGITVTSGAVNEPYLEGLPHPDIVFRSLFAGANVGDAFLRGTAFLQWMVINIGDPLYRPFSGGRAPFNSTASVGNSLTLDKTFVVGGQSLNATLTLSQPAPADGLNIKLTNSRPGAITIPGSISIVGGATQAKFSITTSMAPNYQPAHITAAYNDATIANTITTAPLLALLTVARSSIASDSTQTGTIFLNDSAPTEGALISLSSDNVEAVTVPSSVFIPAGASQSTFNFTAGSVASNTTVTITASHNGAKETFLVTVLPTPDHRNGQSRKIQ